MEGKQGRKGDTGPPGPRGDTGYQGPRGIIGIATKLCMHPVLCIAVNSQVHACTYTYVTD